MSDTSSSPARLRPNPRIHGRHRCTAPRALHILDIENLVAGQITASSVQQMWREYLNVLRPGRDDQFVISVNDATAATVWYALPHHVTRVLAGHGKDAADHALIRAIDVPHVASRFQRLVIGSADHYFTGVARLAKSAGLSVAVVSASTRTPAATLYVAATEHLVLRGENYLDPAAA